MIDSRPRAATRPRFRFETDPTISAIDKRGLSRLSTKHAYEALAYTNQAYRHLDAGLDWIRRLEVLDQIPRNLDLREDDETDDTEREGIRLIQELRQLLEQAHARLEDLRVNRLTIAVGIEEALDPFLSTTLVRTPPKQDRRRQHGLEMEQAVAAEVASQGLGATIPPPVAEAPVVIVPVPQPAVAPSGMDAPVPPKLILNPYLMAKSREELSRRKQEDAAKHLPDSSVGTDD